MPRTFSSLSIFAYDLDESGEPVQAWETVVGETEAEAIAEATEAAAGHAGVLVVRRDGRPAVGEEGDPVVIFFDFEASSLSKHSYRNRMGVRGRPVKVAPDRSGAELDGLLGRRRRHPRRHAHEACR